MPDFVPSDHQGAFSCLSTAIMPDDPSASLNLAFEVADFFGIKNKQARVIAAELGTTVPGRRGGAKAMGLSAREIERMASAFQHNDLNKGTWLRRCSRLIGRLSVAT